MWYLIFAVDFIIVIFSRWRTCKLCAIEPINIEAIFGDKTMDLLLLLLLSSFLLLLLLSSFIIIIIIIIISDCYYYFHYYYM